MTELKDKIHQDQEKISAPHAEAQPSKVNEVFWIYARRKVGKYPRPSHYSGKWLIFVNANKVNEVWSVIKKATEEGKLGNNSKVATARPNPNATNPDTKVICVYTYDSRDEADVKRVREELRTLGITQKIPYKEDQDTMKGKYAVKGDRKISKYYE